MKRLYAAFLLVALLAWANLAWAAGGFQNFQPSATTANISCGVSSTNVQLTGNGTAVEIYNSGSVTCFIATGTTSAITASASTGYPIPPGVTKIIGVPSEQRWIAGITSSGSATVYFSPGEGS